MTQDQFGTAALRAAALTAWRSSPARLREDANVEEDHARGYYRDRVVVELAQNAADAAVRAGVPGRLLLRLARTDEGTTLVAANTGAPLDDAGVAALSSMRASAKRDHGGPGVVGRYGVGFAAVRAVSDEISVVSATGAVRFSLADTAQELADVAERVPALAQEVVRRDGSLPALRLPFAAEGRPPEGFDTAVVLVLRDEVAADEVRSLLHAVDDALLLALPGLTEVVVEDETSDGGPRRVADVASRWFVATSAGDVPRDLLTDRPVEEREATRWRVTWALPRRTVEPGGRAPDPFSDEAAGVPARARVVHAPTPTDEPLDLPALLVATLPLDPTRRRVAAGRLTDALLRHAADAYATLAEQLASAGHDPLTLVPTTLPTGTLDAALRPLLVDRLAAAPILTPATTPPATQPLLRSAAGVAGVSAGSVGEDGASQGLLRSAAGVAGVSAGSVGEDGASQGLLRSAAGVAGASAGSVGDGLVSGGAAPDGFVVPRRAVAVAGGGGAEALAVLGRQVGALVVVPPGRDAHARLLGVDVRPLAELVEELAAPADDEGWPALYGALESLAAADPAGLESLANLPVPLADGRVVRGARGTVVLDDALAGLVRPVVGTLARWGVRVVDPVAAHPLLERLGARAPDAVGLLRLAPVREAVLAWDEDDEPDEPDLTTTVLTLVAAHLPPRDPARWSATTDAAQALPGDVREWLALLPVGAATGERAPADGLVLPGSPAHRLLDERVLTAVSAEEVDRWGAATLVAAGVREVLVTVTVPDVVTEEEQDEDAPGALTAQALDGWAEYVEHLADELGAGAYLGDLTAVADLDAVANEAWPQVLELVAGEPALRRALLEEVRSDRGAVAESYTAWWLRERSPLGLGAPFAVADDGPLRALLPAAPRDVAHLDVQVLRALGGVAEPHDLTPHAWTDLLDSWPTSTVLDVRAATAVWRHAAPSQAPERVPALVGPGRVIVVPAHDAAVAPWPMWWQRTDVAALVPAHGHDEALRLSRELDLPRVSELAPGVVTREDGVDAPVPPQVHDVLPGAPRLWCEHEDLRVDHVQVEWWVDEVAGEPRLHATTLAGLAAALAQWSGRWGLRHLLELALADPERAGELALDAAFEQPPGTGDAAEPAAQPATEVSRPTSSAGA